MYTDDGLITHPPSCFSLSLSTIHTVCGSDIIVIPTSCSPMYLHCITGLKWSLLSVSEQDQNLKWIHGFLAIQTTCLVSRLFRVRVTLHVVPRLVEVKTICLDRHWTRAWFESIKTVAFPGQSNATFNKRVRLTNSSMVILMAYIILRLYSLGMLLLERHLSSTGKFYENWSPFLSKARAPPPRQSYPPLPSASW